MVKARLTKEKIWDIIYRNFQVITKTVSAQVNEYEKLEITIQEIRDSDSQLSAVLNAVEKQDYGKKNWLVLVMIVGAAGLNR